MIIDLGYITDDKRVVNKKFTTTLSINAQLKENTNLINPSLIIEYSGNFGFNYLYIPAFARYYYIEDIIFSTGGRAIIKCHVDVLNTYKDAIKNISTTIDRQENTYNNYIVDNNVQVRTKRYINQHKIGSVDGASIILCVTGS